MSPSLIIYTDGGYRRTTDIGAWGFLIINLETKKAIAKANAVPSTTNNRMELLAVVEALKTLPISREIRLVSDSQYTIKTCNEWLKDWKARGWKKSTPGELKNVDILQQLDLQLTHHKVTAEWVAGHSGNPGNEFVDTLLNHSMDYALEGSPSEINRRYETSPIRVP